MSRRMKYIVTITDDDPTLAAQAHAAILAVPGVVGVEPIDYAREAADEAPDPTRLWVCPVCRPYRGDIRSVLYHRGGRCTAGHALAEAMPGLAPTYTVGDEEDGDP